MARRRSSSLRALISCNLTGADIVAAILSGIFATADPGSDMMSDALPETDFVTSCDPSFLLKFLPAVSDVKISVITVNSYKTNGSFARFLPGRGQHNTQLAVLWQAPVCSAMLTN
jgi:hypothetical protein